MNDFRTMKSSDEGKKNKAAELQVKIVEMHDNKKILYYV